MEISLKFSKDGIIYSIYVPFYISNKFSFDKLHFYALFSVSLETYCCIISKTESSSNTSKLVFCIGGAYGFSDQIRKTTKMNISLSKMTLAHKMVPLLLLEQIYRAYTIKIGHQYHKI